MQRISETRHRVGEHDEKMMKLETANHELSFAMLEL